MQHCPIIHHKAMDVMRRSEKRKINNDKMTSIEIYGRSSGILPCIDSQCYRYRGKRGGMVRRTVAKPFLPFHYIILLQVTRNRSKTTEQQSHHFFFTFRATFQYLGLLMVNSIEGIYMMNAVSVQLQQRIALRKIMVVNLSPLTKFQFW